MRYAVVWDGTRATSRYLLMDEPAPTREAPPLPASRRFTPRNPPRYRVGAVLRALGHGPGSTRQIGEMTGLSPVQASTAVQYLRRTGRVTIAGHDGRYRTYRLVEGAS